MDVPVSSYEWEDPVQRLCESDDAELHDLGIKEFGELKWKRPDIRSYKQDAKRAG